MADFRADGTEPEMDVARRIVTDMCEVMDVLVGEDWENDPQYKDLATRVDDLLVFVERGERRGELVKE